MATPKPTYLVTLKVTVDEPRRLQDFATEAWEAQAFGYKRPSTPTEARAIRSWLSANLWDEEWAMDPDDAGLDVTVTTIARQEF